MSRTIKGSKGPGFEYWGRRPMNGCKPSRWAKRMTHKAERAAGQRLLIKEKRELS